MSNTDHCITTCNRLLRGERSAVETYDKAIEKYHLVPALQDLKRIRADHAAAVSRLEANVRSMGGEPEEGSGAWGTFVNTIMGAANFLGEESAVAALRNGETHGKSDYEDALKDEGVMPECKTMINTELLPRTVEHLATLEDLQKKV